MTSIVKYGSSLGTFPTFPSPNPHYNRPSGHWPWVKSCLVGGRNKYRLVCDIGGKRLYSGCFLKCFFYYFVKIACIILVGFPSSFFSKCYLKVQVVQPYNSTDTATAWKNSCFISSETNDSYVIINLLIACYFSDMHKLISLFAHS